MVEPQKPFACTMPECGMTFTNEDHLHVHKKKHDMVLQLGLEQKAAFVADQTPTPTRFIRNCEEVGLFQDLQNVTVNPFDEGFKRAMETKHGILSLESAASGDDVLHTPQMVFPLIDSGDSVLFSAPGVQRNIIISRSSSDESGTIKEYETTTISKLTNEVTTISRIVGSRDVLDKASSDDISVVKNIDIIQNKDIETVSYKNNVIKIHGNVEIRKDNVNVEASKIPILIYTDSAVKDTNTDKDVLLTDTSKLQVPDKVPPIMSQKSLDFVVDSLTSELNHSQERDKRPPSNDSKANNDSITSKTNENSKIINKTAVATKKHAKAPSIRKAYRNMINEPPNVLSYNVGAKKTVGKSNIKPKRNATDDYEVIIKLPNGKQVRMKAVEENKPDTKEILRNRLTNKMQLQTKIITAPSINNSIIQNVLQMGTLIPVTLVNEAGAIINTSLNNIPVTNTINVTNIPVTNAVNVTNIPVTNTINVSNIPVTNAVNVTNIPVTSAVNVTNIPVTNTVLNSLTVTNTVNNKVGIPISNNLKNLAKVQINNANTFISNPELNVTYSVVSQRKKRLHPNAIIINTKANVKKKSKNKRNADANSAPSSNAKVSEPYQIDNNTEVKELNKHPDTEVICLTDDENNEIQNDAPVVIDLNKIDNKDIATNSDAAKRSKFEMESRCEASKRYRERLRESMREQREENCKLIESNRRLSEEGRQLREANQRLIAEKAVLKLMITEHMRSCPNADHLRMQSQDITKGVKEALKSSAAKSYFRCFSHVKARVRVYLRASPQLKLDPARHPSWSWTPSPQLELNLMEFDQRLLYYIFAQCLRVGDLAS